MNRLMLAVLKLLGLRPRQPDGARVDRDARPTEPPDDRSTLPMDSWTTSSMDLLDGVQVVELHDPPPRDPKPH